ncbi:MAG: hypothetical protein FJX75_17135 [Armatimonadetes bacterium]|nr:hypothetical protein [Armatimonadota bacterium]
MRSTAVALAGLLASLATGQTILSPELRHVNIIALEVPRGTTLSIDARCEPHGDYQDPLRCRLLRPDGYVAATVGAVRETGSLLTAPVDWDGRCAIEVVSGWNVGRLAMPADMPHAYRAQVDAPLKTVGPWGPLYFSVPPETKAFDVFLQSDVTGEGLHATVRSPQGEVASEQDGDFDQRTKVTVQVADGQAGAWSVEVSRPQGAGLGLDDVYFELGPQVPPFLAPKPEWADLFAKGWSPEAATQVSTRLQPVPPMREPYGGAVGPDMDAAYARMGGKDWRTSLPFTYVLDYGSKHLGNPDYVPSVETAPPTLLHLGKDVPFNHGWGPIKALGGENQAFGTDEFIQRLTPDEVRDRITGLRGMVDSLHEAGVRWVTPYVCGMTLDGDEQKRTGFWEFYDHWNEYLPLGLAPRPKPDPFEWLQRNPDGTPRQYYRYNYPAEHYPPFKTNHRYAACWRRDGWATWLSEVVRFAAQCGCDGVFVDNSLSQQCRCEVCLAAFRDFIGEPGADWPAERSGPLVVAANRFWCETLAQELATLKAVGSKELGREFIVFPNGGSPAWIQRGLPDADFVMFEKSIGDYGTNPGMVLSPLFPGVNLRAYNDNLFEHKFVQSLHARVRPIILSRGGYPRQLPDLVMNPNSARLGMAECAAFSGGGGFLISPDFPVFRDPLNEYRSFFEAHPDLYAGLDTYAQTAVLAFPEQSWQGNAAHLSAAEALTTALSEAHVLFDLVPESRFSEETLGRYSFVVAADLNVLSDADLGTLAAYVQGGGRLILSGRFAEQDEAGQPRDLTAGEWARVALLKAGETITWGKGAVVKRATLADIVADVAAQASVLTCPDERLAPHVKVNAFCTPTAPQRIIVHVVNYNVPLGVQADPPEEVAGITLAIPVSLPKGGAQLTVSVLSPDGGAGGGAAAGFADGKVTVQLPPLAIYRVVEIAL